MKEENKKEIRLDLGCGNNKKPSFIGIDKELFPGNVDVVTDLDVPGMALPYTDDSVDEIRAEHFLEHIHNLFPLMNECFRVLKPGGKFEIIVPLAESPMAFGDPTHVRFFTGETFHYFTKSPPGNYANPEIKGKWKILLNDWTPMLEEDTEKIIIHKRRELHVFLTPEKELPKEEEKKE